MDTAFWVYLDSAVNLVGRDSLQFGLVYLDCEQFWIKDPNALKEFVPKPGSGSTSIGCTTTSALISSSRRRGFDKAAGQTQVLRSHPFNTNTTALKD